MRWTHLLLLSALHHALLAAALPAPAPQGIFDNFKRPRRNSAPQVSYTYQVNNHYHLAPVAPPPPPPVVFVPHPAPVPVPYYAPVVPYAAPVAPHPAAVAAHMQAQAQAQAAEAHAQAQRVQAVHAAARAAQDHAQQAWQRDQARIFAEQQMLRVHAPQAQAHYPPARYNYPSHPSAPAAPVAPYPPLRHNRFAATATGYPPGPGQFSSAARSSPPRRATTPPPFNTAPYHAETPANHIRPVRQPTLAIMPPPSPESDHHSHAHSSTHRTSRAESRRPPSILSDFSIPPAVGQRPIAKYRPALEPEPEWDHEEGPSSRPSRGGERSRSRSNKGKKRRSGL
ncbi:hypothetical protein HYPSUDRAFT_200096 [Hypholoma sublateritium FD-334 SS-4]|uniref:Uncharacterized protein n=1 Tax=Hypholoma sublateritium (strain FD-334 SS-4) TaxID=945553 RepID=A0A0D2P9I3_HYPSF|nr:hypothetical protein HYPSUDRAFT_200096 [Hypholoma sublateritium FD-334 SS-4]